MDINLFLFSYFCYILQQSTRSEVEFFFFRYWLFRFRALIFAYILMTHKCLLHVFTFSTNPPRKALKKEIKSAKK